MIDLSPLPGRLLAGYALVGSLFEAAIEAVDPEESTFRAVTVRDGRIAAGDQAVPVSGKVVVTGMGKAAARMAIGLERALIDVDVAGVVVAKDTADPQPRPARIEVLRASHPLPDERSIAAGNRLLAEVGAAQPGDVVVALISGGGSALAEFLRPPVTLDDLRHVTDLLLRAGATINELNAVRRALSRIKAGGLLEASPVPVVPLILSDVIGNDLGTIASGAVIPGPGRAASLAEARAVVTRFGLDGRLPVAVRAALDQPGANDIATATAASLRPVITGDNAMAVSAIFAAARSAGQCVVRPGDWQGRTGEASELATEFVATCRAIGDDVDVVIGGGEATVTVRGDGDGGRNTEFAIAAAIALEPLDEQGWVIASISTDGEDATTGAAGAAVDGGSVRRAGLVGVDARSALDRNDSLPWCRAAAGLILPGSTGTNVNDVYIGVRIRD